LPDVGSFPSCSHKKQSKSERDKRRRKAVRQFIRKYLFDMACADCGESDIRCLDFDHIIGDKKSQYLSGGQIAGRIGYAQGRTGEMYRFM